MNLTPHFGQYFVDFMTEKSMKGIQLAKMIDVAPARISEWRIRKNPPNQRSLERIRKVWPEFWPYTKEKDYNLSFIIPSYDHLQHLDHAVDYYKKGDHLFLMIDDLNTIKDGAKYFLNIGNQEIVRVVQYLGPDKVKLISEDGTDLEIEKKQISSAKRVLGLIRKE